MRLVFMGTPLFAVPSLRALIDGGREIVAVVTQPDRRQGRGRRVCCSPIKAIALELNLPVLQPETVKSGEFIETLRALDPDAIVVVAFGQIIPGEIVHMPPYGSINVHASLLPQYRGASPIQTAIMDGCTKTGVTTMLMDEGCDTGCILLQEQVTIADRDTAGSLEAKLAPVGARLLVETLRQLEAGELVPIPQDEECSSHAPKLRKQCGEVDWTMTDYEIVNLVRGVTPWPGAFTCHRGKPLKIWEVTRSQHQVTAAPGVLLEITDEGLLVATGGRPICLTVVQPPNRARMSGKDYANGYQLAPGEVLGGIGV